VNQTFSYEDAPRPKIAADEVLIRVQAAAVNPLDCKIRAGYFKGLMPHKLPLILGWDVAGEIVEVGSQVCNFHIADAVYALADMMRDGAYAGFIAVRAADVAPKPTSLNPVQAACVPMTGLTAWQALFHTGKLSPGQTALIHGAAGGVGSFAVQFAKLQGAEVIGTAQLKIEITYLS
jgi:NADPH:quinone reductase-like Zn-dependent oxidoreductase